MTKRARIYAFITRQRNILRKAMIDVMTRVTEVTLPSIMSGGDGGESTGRRALEIVKLARTIISKRLTLSKKVLHRKPKGSKSLEQLLSVVN
jgi:hypothetical protein